MDEKRPRVEEFTLNGDEVVARVKELIQEGNVRRLVIKNEDGRVLLEVPLTIGVVGGVIGVAFLPVLAAIGALAALATRLSIVVERTEDGPGDQPVERVSPGPPGSEPPAA